MPIPYKVVQPTRLIFGGMSLAHKAAFSCGFFWPRHSDTIFRGSIGYSPRSRASVVGPQPTGVLPRGCSYGSPSSIMLIFSTDAGQTGSRHVDSDNRRKAVFIKMNGIIAILNATGAVPPKSYMHIKNDSRGVSVSLKNRAGFGKCSGP